ncbi:unnamed protein product [Pleuronectes platessa]|uniref:Uncharacterized protein n=1 Tax=Pleuronectes platessa TaxID=8262 RepID=A0A9N7YNF5_PLEPL|nr:unnamed protein product [Pleuronectes platessa]
MRRRGAAEQAKGSADIHGNLRIHSVVIISINAERQWQGEGRGQGGVGEFWGLGLGGMLEEDEEEEGGRAISLLDSEFLPSNHLKHSGLSPLGENVTLRPLNTTSELLPTGCGARSVQSGKL